MDEGRPFLGHGRVGVRSRRGRRIVEKNLGPVDRAIRVTVGVAVLGIGLFVVGGVPGAVLDLLGAVAVFSGAVGFCHVYEFFGLCGTAKKS
jgi:hypothetical protein